MPSIVDILTPPFDKKVCEKMVDYYEKGKEYEFKKEYDSSITNFGKFLELVAKAVYKYTTGDDMDYPCGTLTIKITNSKTLNDNLRLHIPRAIDAAYGIRNGRDAAHSTIKMDTSAYDCAYVSSVCDWILGELLVELGNSDRSAVLQILESIVSRKVPFLFKDADGKQIILSTSLTAGEEALVKIYSLRKPLSQYEILVGSNQSRDNLRHQLRRMEVKKLVSKLKDKTYELTPTGTIEATKIILRIKERKI